MVKTILKLEQIPKLDDTTDAIAIAICHANSSKYNDYLKNEFGDYVIRAYLQLF